MQDHAASVLDVAAELGIRYLDCARSYGRSEEFVSKWLEARPAVASSMVCGSKWGYEYTAGWRVEVGEGEAHEVKKHTRAQHVQQLAESLRLLPELALYQIHSATLESGVLSDDDVLDALAALRETCVVGLSVSHPQVPAIEAAVPIERGGRPLFGSVQATFNLLDQSAGDALRRAHEAGCFVVIKEALANGRLTSRAPESPRMRVLSSEAAALGTTVDALALAWVMNHPWVGVCLSGASTAEQLRANAAALELLPLPAELHARLGEALSMDCEAYWAERRALAWN